MSDLSEGPGWWLASDGRWYPPGEPPGPVPASPAAGAAMAGEPLTTPTGPPDLAEGHGDLPFLDDSLQQLAVPEPPHTAAHESSAYLPWATRSMFPSMPTLPFIVCAIGGLVTLVGARGPWYTLSLGNASQSLGSSVTASAFGGWQTVIPLCAAVAVALTLALPLVRPYGGWPRGFGWLLRLVALAALATAIVSLFVRKPQGITESSLSVISTHLQVGLSWGAWVGLAGVIVMFLAALPAGSER